MKEPKNIRKTFICNCSSEILLVDVWMEDEERFNEVNLAMFRSYKDNPNIWQRLKYAWWHIRTGKRHLDEISLDIKTANELMNFLKDTID